MTASAQLILNTLKTLAGRGGKITVTNKELMTQTGVNESTITRSIKALIEAGYIERLSSSGDGKPSTYKVNDKPVPVADKPSTVLPDGCDPKSELERHVHDVLTEAGIPHLHDVAYKLVHPDWSGDERCDFLIGHNFAVEVGREKFAEYSAGRERKRQEAARLKITLVDIHHKVGATNYFAANSSYRLNAHPPTEGLEQFIIRIAGLPHPVLPEFIVRCRALEARQRELDSLDTNPRPPKVFKDWNEYNQARAAVAAREAVARAEDDARRQIEWDKSHAPEELARRAERDKLEAERKEGRDFWGDLLDDGSGGTPVAPVRYGQEAEPEVTNAHEDGSWNGEGEPTEEQIDMADRLAAAERQEYESNDDDE